MTDRVQITAAETIRENIREIFGTGTSFTVRVRSNAGREAENTTARRLCKSNLQHSWNSSIRRPLRSQRAYVNYSPRGN